MLHRTHHYDLENIEASPLVFSSFELRNINPYTLLFQTGYITLKSVKTHQKYILNYPNQEVRDSLLQYLLADYSHQYSSDPYIRTLQMKEALDAGSVEDFVEALNSLFASIPFEIFIADREAYYHAVTYLALSLMRSFIRAEVSQSKGKPDAVVFTDTTIYVMEFKMDDSAEAAMKQIREKAYVKPYLKLGKPVKAVGIHFNSGQKAIDAWLEENIG
ncbi:MAG: hypothetical protein HC880_15095 [Bacteroidia bacterium]|nr:hypothetical protein [Bacteroidia bacterium]